jgi:hypothetical protein
VSMARWPSHGIGHRPTPCVKQFGEGSVSSSAGGGGSRASPHLTSGRERMGSSSLQTRLILLQLGLISRWRHPNPY